MTGDCRVFKFLQRSVDGKHLMRFRVKPPFSNSSNVVWKGAYRLCFYKGTFQLIKYLSYN